MAKYVEIFDESGKQLARCVLKDDAVYCSGDADLVKRLEKGVVVTLADGQRKKFHPKDGIAFLHALENLYDSPYMYTSEIKEEENSAAVT